MTARRPSVASKKKLRKKIKKLEAENTLLDFKLKAANNKLMDSIMLGASLAQQLSEATGKTTRQLLWKEEDDE